MTHDPLEIRQLRYFLAVAEAGSFSRAADRLGLSQPSVSQQMRDLEAGLRLTLFQRRGKRIFLTPAGMVFEEHARAMLRQLENCLEELSREPTQLRGALHVGIVPFLDVALLPKLLGAFVAAHPGIRLTVQEFSSPDIETALEEGRVHVGLGFLTRHSPNLRYEPLWRDEISLIIPASHPWAKRSFVNFHEIHEQRLLQLPDTFVIRRMTDDICRVHLVRPRTVAEISSIEALLRSLATVNAAALFPKVALHGIPGLKAVRLRGKNLSVEIGLLRLSDSDKNSAVAVFTRLARELVPKIIGK
jgi:LysR family transcriptional regulator, cyn operon transcriptional activator